MCPAPTPPCPAGADVPEPPRPPVILAHGLTDALAAAGAAAALGVPLVLAGAPGAGGYAGAGWFRALLAAVRAAHPGVALTGILDCGDRPGPALAALRAGVRDLRYTGGGPAAARLTGMAAAAGARLWRDLGPALDLRALPDPDDKALACRTWLAGEPVGSARRGGAECGSEPLAKDRAMTTATDTTPATEAVDRAAAVRGGGGSGLAVGPETAALPHDEAVALLEAMTRALAEAD